MSGRKRKKWASDAERVKAYRERIKAEEKGEDLPEEKTEILPSLALKEILMYLGVIVEKRETVDKEMILCILEQLLIKHMDFKDD